MQCNATLSSCIPALLRSVDSAQHNGMLDQRHIVNQALQYMYIVLHVQVHVCLSSHWMYQHCYRSHGSGRRTSISKFLKHVKVYMHMEAYSTHKAIVITAQLAQLKCVDTLCNLEVTFYSKVNTFHSITSSKTAFSHPPSSFIDCYNTMQSISSPLMSLS